MAERDSAAKRRRDRRLRMHWRHEQLTLRMSLAAALHHSRDVGPVTYNALRSQKTARAWEEEENEMYFATGQMTPPPSSQSCSRRVLPIDAWCGGGWRVCSRWAAVASRRGAAAVLCSAAHRGAERRRRHVPDPGCSYAADLGPTVGAALVCSLS